MSGSPKASIKVSAVMSHFCWGFTKALVDKLEDLRGKDAIYLGGIELAQRQEEEGDYKSNHTEAAKITITLLQKQLYVGISPMVNADYSIPSDIDRLISVAKEILRSLPAEE